jgi:membrane protein
MSKKIRDFLKSFLEIFNEQRVFKEAAALTFVTLLGFVPFVIFILFFIPELPFIEFEDQLSDALIQVFLPSSVDQIIEYISQLAHQKIPFNLFNFIILLVSSYSLFKIINDSFDNILNVHDTRKNTFLDNFVKFLGMTIFGCIFILILFSATSIPIVGKFINLPILENLSIFLTPFVLLFTILIIVYFFIPTIKIRNRSVIIAAAISSLLWILFKSVFNWYIINLTNISLIFDVLAFVPIFLFWIYLNWAIILSGVILVSILEGRHYLKGNGAYGTHKMRITIEKIVDGEVLQQSATNKLEHEELKGILKDIINDDAQK